MLKSGKESREASFSWECRKWDCRIFNKDSKQRTSFASYLACRLTIAIFDTAHPQFSYITYCTSHLIPTCRKMFVFINYLLLRRVSATVPGHFQGAREFVQLYVNLLGRNVTCMIKID